MLTLLQGVVIACYVVALVILVVLTYESETDERGQ